MALSEKGIYVQVDFLQDMVNAVSVYEKIKLFQEFTGIQAIGMD